MKSPKQYPRKNCEHCKVQAFTQRHPSRKFCSNACRQAAYDQRKNPRTPESRSSALMGQAGRLKALARGLENKAAKLLTNE